MDLLAPHTKLEPGSQPCRRLRSTSWRSLRVLSGLSLQAPQRPRVQVCNRKATLPFFARRPLFCHRALPAVLHAVVVCSILPTFSQASRASLRLQYAMSPQRVPTLESGRGQVKPLRTFDLLRSAYFRTDYKSLFKVSSGQTCPTRSADRLACRNASLMLLRSFWSAHGRKTTV